MSLDSSIALCSLAQVKRDLSITGSSEDAYLEHLIHVASDEVHRFCNRAFPAAEVEGELLVDNGAIFYTVEHTPLVSIDAIHDDDEVIDSDHYAVLNAEAGLVRLRYQRGAHRSARRPGIEQLPNPGFDDRRTSIDYTGGYVTPVQAADASSPFFGDPITLPYTIQQAAIEAVASLRSNRGLGQAPTGNITSERIGDAQVIYERSPSYVSVSHNAEAALPQHVKSRLKRFRRIVVI
jgi:hypothetical protein